MSTSHNIDPERFADRWSFNGPYYAWICFFYGLTFLTGKKVAAHDAFRGHVYHTSLFGPRGALYAGLDKLGQAEAEARLSFSERVMDRLRRNETRYLLGKARALNLAGLLLASCIIVGTIAAFTYGVGKDRAEIAFASIPGLVLPFIAGGIGKTVVQRLWDAKRARMGSFIEGLPWTEISTSKSR